MYIKAIERIRGERSSQQTQHQVDAEWVCFWMSGTKQSATALSQFPD